MENIEKLNCALFNGIRPEELKKMLSCLGYHNGSFKKGEIIFREGEEIKHIGIVLDGAVDIVKEDISGNRTSIARVYKGGLFAIAFACGSVKQSAVSYVTAEDSKVLFLPIDRVLYTCDNTCSFHQKLVVNLAILSADESQIMIRKLEVVTKRSIREKILAYLQIQGRKNNSQYFEIPLGRMELADYLCVDRSALTRELSKMKQEALIDFDGNWFRLL